MKYKRGDFVTLPPDRPKDTRGPGWDSAMDDLLGITLPIIKTNPHSNPPTYYISGWWWCEDWITPLNSSSLEERICNKIKQLDTKWKERDLKFA